MCTIKVFQQWGEAIKSYLKVLLKILLNINVSLRCSIEIFIPNATTFDEFLITDQN